MAQRARATLAEWSRAHYGYRQQDVREILAILDEAISDLRAAAGVTRVRRGAGRRRRPTLALEPLAAMPSLREQIDQAFRVAALTERPSNAWRCCRPALQLLTKRAPSIPRGRSRRAAPARRDADPGGAGDRHAVRRNGRAG